MSKNRRTSTAKAQAANKRRQNRRAAQQRASRIRPQLSTTSANPVPIPVPWVVLREEGSHPVNVAADGSQVLSFGIASEERLVFAVFNAEGLLQEFIELVGPDRHEDERLLQMFTLRRRAVGDPLFADDPPPAPTAIRSRMTARRELHRFTYKHYPFADDGTRMVLAVDESGHKWLFAITADGVRFDGIWLDVIAGMPDYQAERERFVAARKAAGDPMFAAVSGLGGRS